MTGGSVQRAGSRERWEVSLIAFLEVLKRNRRVFMFHATRRAPAEMERNIKSAATQNMISALYKKERSSVMTLVTTGKDIDITGFISKKLPL